jgi:hypothetical protein
VAGHPTSRRRAGPRDCDGWRASANERPRGRRRSDVKRKKTWGGMPDFLNSSYTACQRCGMTNAHDHSPIASGRRWGTAKLVVTFVLLLRDLVEMFAAIAFAVLIVCSAVVIWAVSDMGFWHVAGLCCVIVVALTSILMVAAESLKLRWGWREAVVEQVRGLCVVVLMVACLSALANLESGALGVSLTGDHPWDWLGLVELPAGIIGIALAVRLITRGRSRMRGNSAERT